MRILITGSRNWTDRRAMGAVLSALAYDDLCAKCEPSSVTIVHGACRRGVDAIADEMAHELGYTVEAHPADWNGKGKSAGFRRNQQMVDRGADECIAFWDLESPGTRDCFMRALRAGIPVRIVPEKK